MVLLFGESAPKSYAVDNTDRWARTVAPPLSFVGKALWPLITVFYHLTRLVNRLTPGGASLESSYVTREEIRNMIKTGEREGILEEEERQMIQRTLQFKNTVAKEVMTPRLDVGAISKELTVREAIEECMQSGHARLPVYDGSLDDVIGVFDIRDLDRDADYDEMVELDVAEVVSPALRVPESKNVDDLLFEMREQRLHMVMVVDEFGATEGLVTIEDIVEEIVGEILVGDEDNPVEVVDDTEVLVRGEVNVDEVNNLLDIDLPEGEEFETIAGFIFNRAGRLVNQGEEFDYKTVRLRAEQVEDTRIQKVRVTVDHDAVGSAGEDLSPNESEIN
jgi:Hemolysins and related proteins containing CBS domains